MSISSKVRSRLGAVIAFGVIAILVGACGSSGGNTNTSNSGSGGSTATTPSSIAGLAQTGVGLTKPTTGSGAKISGGTVTFAEAPSSPPNYINPMYPASYCGINNINELDYLLYRPLYWYGNNYDPTIDYNDSIGRQPVVSNGGKTYTIHLNHYMWSDGEQVSARDLVLWMNVLKANPAVEWCGYVPGKFPDNVTSYRAVNTTTFQITFNKYYNPTWVLYNELSQLTPMPLAWDKTSASSPTPSATSSSAPDLTKAGATKVFAYLNQQGKEISNWASSPLWSVVDGPWKLVTTTSNGEVTFVPNKDYSGPTKASIAKFVEIPFTSESALVDQIRSQGPSGLSVAYIPSDDEPLTPQFKAQGYEVNRAASYSVNYFPLNFQNPTVGPVFRQLYFRQAFQHLVDQNAWITSFLHGTALPSYSSIPPAPPNSLLAGVTSTTNPYPFSTAAAAALLKANGWKVVPGGLTTCIKPGTATGDCGAGIKQGEGISFNLDYMSSVTSIQEEMEDLQSQASKVGIKISLTSHPFNDVYAAAVHCTSNEPKCSWTAQNWGAGWIYGPDYYPTGDDLFQTGSIANYSNYSDPTMDKLIAKTIDAPPSQEHAAMKAFVKYSETELPVVFEPTQIGTFGSSAGTLVSDKIGGYTANALGWLSPETWYLTK